MSLRNFALARSDMKSTLAAMLGDADCSIHDDYIPETSAAAAGIALTLQSAAVDHVLDGGEQSRFTWIALVCAKSRAKADDLLDALIRIDRYKTDFYRGFAVEQVEDLQFVPGQYWYAAQLTIAGIK